MLPSNAAEGSLPLSKDSVECFESFDVILNANIPIFGSQFRVADFYALFTSSFRRNLRSLEEFCSVILCVTILLFDYQCLRGFVKDEPMLLVPPWLPFCH